MIKKKIKKTVPYIVLTIASIISVFPLLYMFTAATNASVDIIRGKLTPGTYLIENFKSLVSGRNVGDAQFLQICIASGNLKPSGLLPGGIWIRDLS